MHYTRKQLAVPGRSVRTRANTPLAGSSDIHIGIGWNEATGPDAVPFDLDLHLALCDKHGKAIDMVYHQHQVSNCAAAYLTGDNTDGHGPGWDEAIGVCKQALHPSTEVIKAFVVIDEAAERSQSFGLLSGGFVSATDSKGQELVHRGLGTFGGATALVVAQARRSDGWDMRFPFQPTSFDELASSFGLDV